MNVKALGVAAMTGRAAGLTLPAASEHTERVVSALLIHWTAHCKHIYSILYGGAVETGDLHHLVQELLQGAYFIVGVIGHRTVNTSTAYFMVEL